MIIFFPAMCRELAADPALPEALLLDPGATDEPEEGAFRPEGLPLDPKKARRIVEDSLRFGEQFKKPGDMAAMALFQQGEKEQSWSIRAELAERLRHDSNAAEPAAKNDDSEEAHRAQAQFLLLLGRALQERSVELGELSRSMDEAWSDFGERLGLDEDEDDGEVERISRALTGTAPLREGGGEPLPWPWLLGAMAAFLPEGSVLAASDAEQAAAWKDLDLEFAASADGSVPEGWLAALAPAYRLAGLRRAPKGAHWTRELVAAIPEN